MGGRWEVGGRGRPRPIPGPGRQNAGVPAPAGAMARSPTAPGPWARRIHSPRKAEAMTHTRRTSAAELRRPRARQGGEAPLLEVGRG